MLNLFVILSSVLIIQNNSNDFLVSTKILNTPNKEEIIIIVDVKNISNKPIKTAKRLFQYYKWNSGKNVGGNYIIEIEKFENGVYSIFSPTADIDPVPGKKEYTYIQNGKTLVDTLQIKGYLFSQYKEHGEGFPTGIYRLRVYFNPSWMGMDDTDCFSEWIEFKIN